MDARENEEEMEDKGEKWTLRYWLLLMIIMISFFTQKLFHV